MKREKRRLDEMLTIREEEISRLRKELSSMQEDYRSKLKHLEDRYDRALKDFKSNSQFNATLVMNPLSIPDT